MYLCAVFLYSQKDESLREFQTHFRRRLEELLKVITYGFKNENGCHEFLSYLIIRIHFLKIWMMKKAHLLHFIYLFALHANAQLACDSTLHLRLNSQKFDNYYRDISTNSLCLNEFQNIFEQAKKANQLNETAFLNLPMFDRNTAYSFSMIDFTSPAFVYAISRKQVQARSVISPSLFDGSSYYLDKTTDDKIQLQRIICYYGNKSDKMVIYRKWAAGSGFAHLWSGNLR
jgi:hypothetical protein